MPSSYRSLILGGLLPVVVYTIIEETQGLLWGLVAGMAVGVGEILWEWRRQGKVDPITWGGNGVLLVMGGISLATQEGVWFRLQPAILEMVFGVGLLWSAAVNKPFLTLMARKQGLLEKIPQDRRPWLEARFRGLTGRIGVFFLLHAALATWAALAWSTRAWALLKGVGFTLSFVAYMAAEVVWMRRSAAPYPSPPANR